ncbi:hypothetical protein MVEN_01305000 [Mycena venus]|uniref:Apple domain-containing protein n=1 Tax=Mycena venus TaxID=2733690 RepID=A0A8H6XYP7_9AGAR|nr:hypothetical protein MVEN_01305000 [Mycena venus]
MQFSLSLATLLFSVVVANAAAAGIQPVPDVGTVFSVYPGWDMDNGTLETIFNGTELACLQSCASSGSCVAYAYVPYGNTGTEDPFCVLKNSIDLSTFTVHAGVDVSVGLIGSCGTVTPVGPTICQTVSI